jgi:hypothetical protein
MWSSVVCSSWPHAHILQAPSSGSEAFRVTNCLATGFVDIPSSATNTMLTISLRYKAPAGPHGVGGNFSPLDPKGYYFSLNLLSRMLIHLSRLPEVASTSHCCVRLLCDSHPWWMVPMRLLSKRSLRCLWGSRHSRRLAHILCLQGPREWCVVLTAQLRTFVFHRRSIWTTRCGNLRNSTTQMEARL